MNIRQRFLRTTGTWLLLGAFMSLTAPGSLPVVLLIVPFVLLFLACYSSWILVQRLRSWFREDRDLTSVNGHRPLGIALSLSLALLLVLQSLGQLSLRDVVTVFAIVVLGYAYFGRSRFVLPKR